MGLMRPMGLMGRLRGIGFLGCSCPIGPMGRIGPMVCECGRLIELHAGGGGAGELLEHVLHGFDDEMADGEVVVETNFAFGGMDVDVDAGGVHLEEEDGYRIAALHEGVVVALEEAEVERAVFDGTLEIGRAHV